MSAPIEPDEELFHVIGTHLACAIGLVAWWQAAHPKTSDARVNELVDRLARAKRLASYMRDGVNPEMDAARAALIASGFNTEES